MKPSANARTPRAVSSTAASEVASGGSQRQPARTPSQRVCVARSARACSRLRATPGIQGVVDDAGKPLERRIAARQVVLAQDCVEAALVAVVAQLGAGNVIRRGALTLGDGEHLVSGRVQELGFGIDEALDQPRAGDAVDLWSFAGDPLHAPA